MCKLCVFVCAHACMHGYVCVSVCACCVCVLVHVCDGSIVRVAVQSKVLLQRTRGLLSLHIMSFLAQVHVRQPLQGSQSSVRTGWLGRVGLSHPVHLNCAQ